MRLVESQDFENLHLAYIKRQDLGGDGVWEAWQIEGPRILWYFRAEPHVHCWVHSHDARERTTPPQTTL